MKQFLQCWIIGFALVNLANSAVLAGESVKLQTRARTKAVANEGGPQVVEKQVEWDAGRTAVVICDMWDKHHCPDATERVGEMAPRMNEVLKAARSKGMLIIHCPSDTLGFYKNHPGRKLAQSAPKVETKTPLAGWCSLDGVKEPALPIDDSDGGCDGCPECPGYGAWIRQHPALEIKDGDAITDSAEAFYLMRQRGITNVIIMGVHINMCVLGRPFAIRQLVAQGQNVVLMRDLTDSMYNHRKRPFVSHFRGTELVVEHIEQYWCPSITSADLLGGEPFNFQGDIKKRIAIIIGENEYHTWETLPDFARKELEWRGYQISYVLSSSTDGDPKFTNYEAIKLADLVLVSVRRRTPPRAMMELLRAHIDAGKPVVGIRTASHAFDATPTGSEYASWSKFDVDVFGGHYEGHYNNKPPAAPHTTVERVASNSTHVVLTGIKSAAFNVTSHLYKSHQLARTTLPLLQGRIEGQDFVEPVAWVNTAQDRRVFYTSLGDRGDFQLPTFRRLLLNGILWCLKDPVPPSTLETTERSVPRLTPQPSAQPISTPVSLDLPQETQTPPLSPKEAVSKFRIADDLEWEQVLSEPQISQPVFLNFDEKGRMWVVEYRQYPSPAGLKLVSHDSVWRSVYDKVPPPPPHHFKGVDRITIHEDSNGDGIYDLHKTFLDDLNIVTSVERGRGGVWILNPPYLLFYPDSNDDDRPDGDPEVRLAGFGLEDTHSVANSLRWGPDGWLYGAQGSTVTANILVYGPDGIVKNPKPIYSQGQNIWRYHPEKRIYEIFSEGGGNAFGCEIDSQGRIFSGHNGGDTRGFHYFQGAYLQKGFEKHGPLSNPYAFGYFTSIPQDSVPRFTHNFIIYDHGSLPAQYTGRLLGIEPLQGRIVQSEILPDRSSFRTKDISRPVTSDDRWFRPVDIKVGPEGAVYICDWYDQQVNHFRNHEGKLDTGNGRIYRLKTKGSAPVRSENLGTQTSAQLLERLAHPNRWVRQTALRLLADRKDPSVIPKLSNTLHETSGQISLETLWALNLCGGLTDSEVRKALKHSDPSVRLWTVRLVGDEKSASRHVASELTAMASTEKNLEVRNQLAATAKRFSADQCLPIIRNLAMRDEDTQDNRMPLLIWWAIEAHCENNPDAVLQLFADASFWRGKLVETHLLDRIIRRFAQAGSRQDLLNCARLFDLSPSVEHSRRLITGFETAFKGRTLAGLPAPLTKAMARHGVGSAAFALRQGDPRAIRQAISIVADETASRSERLEFLGVMAEVKVPEAIPVLARAYRGVYKDDALRQAVLSAFQNYDDPSIADIIISAYPTLGRESLATAQTLLASRSAWALKFAQSIHTNGTSWSGFGIKPETIPLTIVRKLKQHSNPELQALLQKHWPSTSVPTTLEMEKKITELARAIRSNTGDPYQGRTLFQNTCANCHKLFSQGAEVGPDLTVHNRADLESMLLAIVNPSAEIREGFENYSVETKDGRSLSGFLVEQDQNTVVLRGLDNQNMSFARKDLSEVKLAGISLMPEGLMEGFSDEQVRDLFAYLRSTQPLVGEPPRRPSQR